MTEKRKRYGTRAARLEGGFWDSEKLAGVSLAARGLYAQMLSYAADKMTDGHVPHWMLPALGVGEPVDELVSELVDGGVIELDVESSGIRIPTYAKHNITRAEWEAEQRRERNKKRKQRSKNKECPQGTATGTVQGTQAGTGPGTRPGSPPRNRGGNPKDVSTSIKYLIDPGSDQSDPPLLADRQDITDARERPPPNGYDGPAIRAAFIRTWPLPSVAPPKHPHALAPFWDEVAAWCASQATAEGSSLDAVLAKLLVAFWADEWCRKTGYKPGALLSEATRLYAQAVDAAAPPDEAKALADRIREEPDADERNRLRAELAKVHARRRAAEAS